MYKKILVPLDRSELAESVLPYTCILAEYSRAEIVLLHVVEYPFDMYSNCYEYPPRDPELSAKLNEEKRAICVDAERYLEQLAARLKKGGHKVSTTVCEGPVVKAILSSLEKVHADLIVMSTHARSGQSHWLIGATADRVLHEANAPVLLIRTTSSISVPDQFQTNSISNWLYENEEEMWENAANHPIWNR